MSADVFFDTNILIYATVEGDAHASVAADLILAGGLISVQVLNEFANVARRKLKRPWPRIRADLRSFQAAIPEPAPITVATHASAVTLAERHGLSFFDALIVASALEAGCTTLLSEDMQNGRVIEGRLTIRNPFTAVSPP
jgi:predicted nucleic acid-binding protein